MQTCSDERELLSDLEHAVNNNNLYHLLQVFAEGVDLAAPLPSSVSTLSIQACSVPARRGLGSRSMMYVYS